MRLGDYSCCLGGINRFFYHSRVIQNYLLDEIELARGKPLHVLDIGCGSCDMAMALSSWSKRKGHDVRFTCIDTDRRAIVNSREKIRHTRDCAITVLREDVFQHWPDGKYDCAIGSMFFRRLTEQNILTLIDHLRKIVHSSVLINDLRLNLPPAHVTRLLSRVENALVSTSTSWLWWVHALLRFTEMKTELKQYKAA